MDNGLVRRSHQANHSASPAVLILVVVDNGLVLNMITYIVYLWKVLILVVVDNGLVLDLIRLY